MKLNMGYAILKNAIFEENPRNSWDNKLLLVLDGVRTDSPFAKIIEINNIHPTVGRMIERLLKRFARQHSKEAS